MTLTLTLLRSQIGGRAGKALTRNASGEYVSVSEYSMSTHFLARSASFEFPNEFCAFLSKAAWAGEFAVRGDLASHAKTRATIMRRHNNPDAKTNCLVDVPRSWIGLDLDGVEVPAPLGAPDRMTAAAIYIRDNILPPEFANVTGVASATTRTGIVGPNVARLRMWFMLNREVGNEELRTWARGYRAATEVTLDPALYNASQPHYLSRPIFIGCEDPIKASEIASVINGEKQTVDLNIAAYSQFIEAITAELKLITLSCGRDWERLAHETIGGADGFRIAIERVIGVALNSGADLHRVQCVIASVLEARGEPGRYSNAWVASAWNSFKRRKTKAQAAADEAVCEVARLLFKNGGE